LSLPAGAGEGIVCAGAAVALAAVLVFAGTLALAIDLEVPGFVAGIGGAVLGRGSQDTLTSPFKNV